jgi:hypothetical protein
MAWVFYVVGRPVNETDSFLTEILLTHASSHIIKFSAPAPDKMPFNRFIKDAATESLAQDESKPVAASIKKR